MSESSKSKRPITDAIKVVLEEGKNVRERITKIVTDQMQGEELTVENLRKTAKTVMDSAVETGSEKIKKAVPPDEDSPLRDVVYGIGDAFGAAAQAAGSTFEDAKKRGQEFASDDVKKVTVELRGLASALVDSIASAAKGATDTGADFAKTAAHHANSAAEKIKPDVESALSAAAQHPVELGKDAAKAGADMTREVAGTIFGVLGQMMDKAAAAVRPTEDKSKADTPPSDG